jgi:hypothetical protein
MEQEEVAVAPHQLQNQLAFDRFPGAGREIQGDHPFPALLAHGHKGQAAEAMLNLPGQGAPFPLPRRRWDRQESGGFCHPAQLKPLEPTKVAKGQLQGVTITLLGFFKAAGHQNIAELPHQGAEGGGIDGLEAWRGSGRAHRRAEDFS